MPLDSHHHLSRLGWQGKGTALREGGLSRPLNVSQKKNLSGVGKDRDEAFPFWDHVFTAAAKSIVIRVPKGADSSGSDSESETPTPAPTPLARTSTGIISNRRPHGGTPALSGASTPTPAVSGTQTPDGAAASAGGSGGLRAKISLLALAKQQAAKSQLYSRFFRGPVLRMEEEEDVREDVWAQEAQGELEVERMADGKDEGEGEVVDSVLLERKVIMTLKKKRKHSADENVAELAEKERKREKKRRRMKKEARRAAEAAAAVAVSAESILASSVASVVDVGVPPVAAEGERKDKKSRKKRKEAKSA
ncbi:hypothetical protein CALCODRAFT_164226 [Calocera cornea HHB12733]|uniref:G-patch domain-containing protein n=1 Tax=Calocera cornea HHB12733 TaxID=1353952 RepID=A0A165CIN5_9BASI|nr:hypothetical protein CALCODRAFT_164226 [Calocera cornea HHB12733]